MSILEAISLLFALLGLATAILAAFYWRKASKVTPIDIVVSPTDVPEAHILSNQVAASKSASPNEIAALWTGRARPCINHSVHVFLGYIAETGTGLKLL
jgi:hypothetical protein